MSHLLVIGALGACVWIAFLLNPQPDGAPARPYVDVAQRASSGARAQASLRREHEPPVEPEWFRRYAALHNHTVSGSPEHRRYLVSRCAVGGLGDRMLGLLSSIVLAVAMDRALLIECGPPDHPFHLSHYLHGGPVRWDLPVHPSHTPTHPPPAYHFENKLDWNRFCAGDLHEFIADDVLVIVSHLSFYVPASAPIDFLEGCAHAHVHVWTTRGIQPPALRIIRFR